VTSEEEKRKRERSGEGKGREGNGKNRSLPRGRLQEHCESPSSFAAVLSMHSFKFRAGGGKKGGGKEEKGRKGGENQNLAENAIRNAQG